MSFLNKYSFDFDHGSSSYWSGHTWLTSAIKMTRLLKDFNSFPGAPKSLVGALNNLIFTSSALNELKPILDNFASVPTETQEAIPFTHLLVPLTGCVYAFQDLRRLSTKFAEMSTSPYRPQTSPIDLPSEKP